MPKQKKYDSIYWRKDRGQWWVSYTDPKSKTSDHRVRTPAADAQNHEEAKIFLEDKRREVRERRNLKPGEVMDCQETFADVADKFLAYQMARLKGRNSYDREVGIVGHLKAFFTGKLADVTPAQVSDYVTARLSAEVRKRGKTIEGRLVSRPSVRKELNTLKHLYRLACGEWKLLPRFANPCLDVKAPKFRDERTQHLSPDQFRRLLAASPDNVRPIFALLTATGMRRSELLTCKWKYVDGARILLPTSKNDEPKEIHLNVFAQKVLASIPQGEPEDLLFPDITPEAVSMAFHRVSKLLSFSDVRLHDLRHTFATWLRQSGVELDVIASQLGHRDLRMTKRYARIASSQVRQAVNGLDSVLGLPEKIENGANRHQIVTKTQEPQEGRLLTA
jgi:integrase